MFMCTTCGPRTPLHKWGWCHISYTRHPMGRRDPSPLPFRKRKGKRGGGKLNKPFFWTEDWIQVWRSVCSDKDGWFFFLNEDCWRLIGWWALACWCCFLFFPRCGFRVGCKLFGSKRMLFTYGPRTPLHKCGWCHILYTRHLMGCRDPSPLPFCKRKDDKLKPSFHIEDWIQVWRLFRSN